MRYKTPILFVLVFAIILVGFYFVFQKFLKDRERVASYAGPQERRVVSDGRSVRTYNAKELEEARKTGKLPKGMESTSASQAAAANEAAVQRTLRTLEEINKINEMNRRLQEQQQRMQKQK